MNTSLKDFSFLPDEAHVRVNVVAALFACSVPTIWRWAKANDGRLPKARKLSDRVTAWNCGELRRALAK